MGNALVTIPEGDVDVQRRIRTVRGVQVILDRDLALLYEVETGQLNRHVKRNMDRFPSDFMFQLTKDDVENLKCQFGISSWGGDRAMQARQKVLRLFDLRPHRHPRNAGQVANVRRKPYADTIYEDS